MDREDFLARVRQQFPYTVEGGTQRLLDTVLQALRRHVTEGEWDDVKSTLPKDLALALP
jgi:uncharacterized protein (DUF2267 family)